MAPRWQLYDPIDNETYFFAVNPNEGGTPGRAKKLTFQTTAAPEGRALIYEGRDDPKQLTVSGTLLDQDQLDTLDAWMDKRHQVQLTDDLGRVFWIYLTSFEPTRNRRANHPYHHSYRLSYVILDQP